MTLRGFISCGAGVQSTALYLARTLGLVEGADAAIFSDTGWEHRDVYDHLDALERWGSENGGPPIHRASRGSLRDDVLDPTVFATIPCWTKSGLVARVAVAFGPCPTCDGFKMLADPLDACQDCNGTGSIATRWEDRPTKQTLGHIVRQCTPKYKVEPLERKMRELLGARLWDEDCRYCHGTGRRVPPWSAGQYEGQCSICRGSGVRQRIGSVPAGTAVEQWIGFSTDEFERQTSVGFPSYSTPRWPLLELGWSRNDCIRWMADLGWKGVAKSSCIGCPFHDDDTWLDIADNDPDTFAELVEYDRLLRRGDGMMADRFLHEARLPLAEAVDAYRTRKARSGEQLIILEELRLRRRVRHCNPFGCRSEEIDAEAVS